MSRIWARRGEGWLDVVAVALIILVLAALLTTAVVLGGGESIDLDLFGVEVSSSLSGLYLTGLMAGAATVVALLLLRAGLRKGWRRRQHVRDLQRRANIADNREPQVNAPTPVTPPMAGPEESDATSEPARRDQDGMT